MINLIESQTIEFKQVWKDEYLKTICAFSNSDGGSNLTNFLLKKYGKTWDDVVVENFTLDDINLETIEKFKMWTRHRAPFIEQEKDLRTLLKRLNLYDGSFLKRAALLLFAKNPQQYFIQSHSKIGKFLSDSELLTSDIVEGNLFEQLEKIIEILRTKYLHSYISYEGLQRIETLEYPYEAVREAVINALIHRDYTDTTVLQIRVYEEKIVFSNGATLPAEVPIEKFKENHISKPFNPIISNMFYKAGFVESWGKGTNNMVDDCLKMHLPEPEYKYTFASVQVIFYKTPQKNTRENILMLMEQDSRVTISIIAQELNVGRDTINEHISRLKKENRVKRVGGRKDGYWEVLDGT